MLKTALKVGFYALFLIFFILLTVLIKKPSDSVSGQVLQTDLFDRAETTASADPGILSRVFDHPFPFRNGEPVSGTVESVPFEGSYARLLTLRYPDCTMSCVMPAYAATVLLHPELTVTDLRTQSAGRYTVLSMPVVYAQDKDTRCFYFSDDSAAYCLYAESITMESFRQLAGSFTWR